MNKMSLEEATLKALYDQLDDSKEVDEVEGLVDDILVITDPEINEEQYGEIIDRAQEIVDDTPEGEIPFDEEWLGQYLQTCPICGATFVTDEILEPGAICPVCTQVPEAFVMVGKVESEDKVAEDNGLGEEESEDAEELPVENVNFEDEEEIETDMERDVASKDIPKGNILTESKDYKARIADAQKWLEEIDNATEAEDLEAIIDDALASVDDIKDTTVAGEDLANGLEDVLDDSDAMNHGANTYFKSVSLNLKNIIEDYINELEESKLEEAIEPDEEFEEFIEEYLETIKEDLEATGEEFDMDLTIEDAIENWAQVSGLSFTEAKKYKSLIKSKIKEVLSLDESKIEEIRKIDNDFYGFTFTEEDRAYIEDLVKDAAKIDVISVEDKDDTEHLSIELRLAQTEFINGGIANISDRLVNKIEEYVKSKYPEAELVTNNTGSILWLREDKSKKESKSLEESADGEKIIIIDGEEYIEHTNDQGKHWYSPKSLDDEELEAIKEIENAKKEIKTENKEINDFEANIPNRMRFKHFDIFDEGNTLYWVTQQFFDEEEVKQFQEALKNTSFQEAYVTVRDLSHYNLDDDHDDGVLVTITADTYNMDDYKEAVKEKNKELYTDLFEGLKKENTLSEKRELKTESEVDDKLHTWFEKYVPTSGKADTEGGEIVRAISKILYRWYNDGDVYCCGYGLETCGNAACFLIDSGFPELLNRADEIPFNTSGKIMNNKTYEDLLNDFAEAVIAKLESEPELFEKPNTIDCLDYDDPKDVFEDFCYGEVEYDLEAIQDLDLEDDLEMLLYNYEGTKLDEPCRGMISHVDMDDIEDLENSIWDMIEQAREEQDEDEDEEDY